MKPPRRRTLAALGAAVAALHGLGLWQASGSDVAVAAPSPQRVAVQWFDVRAATPQVAAPAPAWAAPVPTPTPTPTPTTAAPVRARRPAAATSITTPAVASPPPSAASPPTKAPSAPLASTALPPPLRLLYRLERGDASAGAAELDWQPDGERYAARLLLRTDAGRTIEQTSAGLLGPAGLAPLRFVDRRTGRAMAANFQPERGVIGFSGPSLERPLPDGAQDRLSWMLQLAARAQGDPAAAAAGIELPVFGARGDGGTWRFEPAGTSDAGLLHLRRAAAGPYDGAVEVWLDPARHHLPARLVLHPPAGDARPPLVLELVLALDAAR